MSLDPDFKKKWASALRQDKYKQTIGVLHDPIGFCCLGVACDIEDPTKWFYDEDRQTYIYI